MTENSTVISIAALMFCCWAGGQIGRAIQTPKSVKIVEKEGLCFAIYYESVASTPCPRRDGRPRDLEESIVEVEAPHDAGSSHD